MRNCIVKCSLHEQAKIWLEQNDVMNLTQHLDVFDVLRRRAWKTCSCNLYRNIVHAITDGFSQGRERPAFRKG